ncbi:TetR/AcrR family transcriptional regulator [Azorhizobium doebereinerae]|uniref:TetR/AcrR family transcriptional regulator n=1 Tax=Azorhizobium doebereinerae TaxID=281091 RepID=UPI0004022523|nr:TetR/AcrR family transcriptional regulator [Azorhizobium doebereinerae]
MKKTQPERGRPRAFDRDVALRRAMEVFWAQGYEGASVGDLTAAMGIERPSLYGAFGCKEALFREAVELYGREESGATGRALAREPTARAAVAAMLRDNAAVYVEPGKPPGCLVVLAALVGTPESAPVRQALAERRARVRAAIAARVRQGMAEGDVSRDADPDAIAAFYGTVLHGLSLQARDGMAKEDLLAICEAAMAAWDPLAAPS